MAFRNNRKERLVKVQGVCQDAPRLVGKGNGLSPGIHRRISAFCSAFAAARQQQEKKEEDAQ